MMSRHHLSFDSDFIMSTTGIEPQHNADETTSKRALNWGIITWVANAGGCLLGMIPLALPLSILATIVTFITGIGAMILGVRGKRDASKRGDEQGIRDARMGFWLGAAHMLIVTLVGMGAFAAFNMGAFGDIKF